MRNEKLPTLREMVQYAKDTWDQTFENESECFVDAFENGEYHEEEPRLVSLTIGLTDQELASLYLPVCKAMISGSVSHRDGDTLKLLMDCYSALGRWERKHLSSPDEVLSPLAQVRKLMFSEVLERPNTWWRKVFSNFEMLEAGVRRRMGVNHLKLADDYRAIEHKLDSSYDYSRTV